MTKLTKTQQEHVNKMSNERGVLVVWTDKNNEVTSGSVRYLPMTNKYSNTPDAPVELTDENYPANPDNSNGVWSYSLTKTTVKSMLNKIEWRTVYAKVAEYGTRTFYVPATDTDTKDFGREVEAPSTVTRRYYPGRNGHGVKVHVMQEWKDVQDGETVERHYTMCGQTVPFGYRGGYVTAEHAEGTEITCQKCQRYAHLIETDEADSDDDKGEAAPAADPSTSEDNEAMTETTTETSTSTTSGSHIMLNARVSDLNELYADTGDLPVTIEYRPGGFATLSQSGRVVVTDTEQGVTKYVNDLINMAHDAINDTVAELSRRTRDTNTMRGELWLKRVTFGHNNVTDDGGYNVKDDQHGIASIGLRLHEAKRHLENWHEATAQTYAKVKAAEQKAALDDIGDEIAFAEPTQAELRPIINNVSLPKHIRLTAAIAATILRKWGHDDVNLAAEADEPYQVAEASVADDEGTVYARIRVTVLNRKAQAARVTIGLELLVGQRMTEAELLTLAERTNKAAALVENINDRLEDYGGHDRTPADVRYTTSIARAIF